MRASDWQYGDILDISPVGGGQGPPHTPENEIPNMALE